MRVSRVPHYLFVPPYDHLDVIDAADSRLMISYREHEPYVLRKEAIRSKIVHAIQKHGVSEVGPASIAMPALHEASRLAGAVRKKLRKSEPIAS